MKNHTRLIRVIESPPSLCNHQTYIWDGSSCWTCLQFGFETTTSVRTITLRHTHTHTLQFIGKVESKVILFLSFWITEYLWHYTANQLQMFENVLQVPKGHMKFLCLQNYCAETCQHMHAGPSVQFKASNNKSDRKRHCCTTKPDTVMKFMLLYNMKHAQHSEQLKYTILLPVQFS